jgi:tRNA(fMet)-specific endonuclease VapC
LDTWQEPGAKMQVLMLRSPPRILSMKHCAETARSACAQKECGVRLALDTNRYTDLCRGDQAVIEVVEQADEVWLPFVVVGELRAGFAVGSQGTRNEAVLRRFLLKPGVGILYADEQTTHHYASVYRQLRKQGTPIPTNDMWIAALVLQHSLVLCARDVHFDELGQIVRV